LSSPYELQHGRLAAISADEAAITSIDEDCMSKLLDVGWGGIFSLTDLESALNAGSKALVTIGIDESETDIVVHIASIG
jgi:hypothetical protein